MRTILVIGVLAVAVAGCSSSGPKQLPPLGRGQSLRPIVVYEVVDPTHPARHIRNIRMALLDHTGKVLHKVVDRRPLLVLHPTAAEVAHGVVELYAPEATGFIQYQMESGGFFVGVFDGRGYDVGTVEGDPDGLNVSLHVGPDAVLEESIAHALTTRVRVVTPPSPL
jgi:hypothetical protein